MRNPPLRTRTHFIFALLGFVSVACGSALLAAEPEKAAESAAKTYTATAWLLVERHEPHILSAVAEKEDRGEFESFRVLQMQMIKWRFVLMAALCDPKARVQPGVVREDARHSAVEWLAKQIRVECPDQRTGLITVSLTSSDPNEAAVLVNAVVGAYMTEVVDRQRKLRRERLEDLQAISAEKESEVRTKREQLKRELENIGASRSPAEAAMKQQLTTDKCLFLQRQLLALRSDCQRSLCDLKVKKTAGGDTKALEAQNDSLRGLLAEREKEYQQAYDAAVAEGLTSVAAAMAADEVRVIEETLRAVAVERERLRVEFLAPRRVTVLGDPSAPAAVPECPD